MVANGVMNVIYNEPFYILVADFLSLLIQISKHMYIPIVSNATAEITDIREKESGQDTNSD